MSLRAAASLHERRKLVFKVDVHVSSPSTTRLVSKLLAFVGATIGGWIGWYLGAFIGTFTAFMVSIVGTGVGIYAGRCWADEWSA